MQILNTEAANTIYTGVYTNTRLARSSAIAVSIAQRRGGVRRTSPNRFSQRINMYIVSARMWWNVANYFWSTIKYRHNTARQRGTACAAGAFDGATNNTDNLFNYYPLAVNVRNRLFFAHHSDEFNVFVCSMVDGDTKRTHRTGITRPPVHLSPWASIPFEQVEMRNRMNNIWCSQKSVFGRINLWILFSSILLLALGSVFGTRSSANHRHHLRYHSTQNVSAMNLYAIRRLAMSFLSLYMAS